MFKKTIGETKNGTKKTFNAESDKLESSENYEKDLKQGFTYYYFGKDSISKKIPFDKGRETGTGYEYSRDEKIITILEYKGGFLFKQEKINRYDVAKKKTGTWKIFYPSGLIYSEVNYVNDKMHGIFKGYNEKGSLIQLKKYDNGIEITDALELVKLDIETEFYDSGKPKIVRTTKNGIYEGVERYYSETGNIANAKIYKGGILLSEGIYDESGFKQGKWKEYYPDSTLKSEGEFKDGNRIGEWVFYHPNKTIEQRGKYSKNSKADGLWRWFYDNKQLHREETFVKGKEDGEYLEYDEEGKIITKGQYVDGLEDGSWIYEYGDHKEEGTYRAGNKEGLWKG